MAVHPRDDAGRTDGALLSTGARGVVRAGVQTIPIDVADMESLVDTPDAGACVSFVGKVRRQDACRDVTLLEYSCHPSADLVAARIAAAVLATSHGVHAIAVSHRLGPLRIGEVALACSVSASHREQAFVACRELVERIKAELPVWKHQLFTDGTDEWVGSA